MTATQINKIPSDRAASHFDSSGYVRIMRNKEAMTGVFCNNKGYNNKAPKHRSNQLRFILCKKARMPELNHMSHSAEDCFGKCSNEQTIIDVLGEPMGSRAEYVKQYKR